MQGPNALQENKSESVVTITDEPAENESIPHDHNHAAEQAESKSGDRNQNPPSPHFGEKPANVAEQSLIADSDGKEHQQDNLKYGTFVVSLLALVATVTIAAYQIGISASLRDLSTLANQQALEEKDLSLMSGISVTMTDGEVSLNNRGTRAITNAGYWAVHTSDETYTDYMSKTTPIPGCSSMTFDISVLPKGPSSLNSLVLVFQVPSGDWWSISEIGMLEKSASGREADWTEATTKLKSFSLQADTVMEGFGSHQIETIDGVTGPTPSIEAYVTDNGPGGINASVTELPCT